MNTVEELSKDGIKLKLITGNIDVSVPGNYVIASGCGSGKTSAIIQLIKLKKHKGIIYSARTIDECETMYEYLCDEGLKDDILLLHSHSDDNAVYINNPEFISRYKIIICTHHKLMNTPSELLLLVKSTDESIPPHMRYWNQDECHNKSMRKYILVDEMIEKPGFTTMVDKSLIAGLVMAIQSGQIRKSKYGYNYSDVLDWYKHYSEVLNSDPLRYIDRYKAEYTLSLISENLDKYKSRLSDESQYIEVSYTLLDLLPGRSGKTYPDHFPYFMIFDGTGDIFYKNSSNLTILTTEDRYRSKIRIKEFDFNLSRYQDQPFESIKSELKKAALNIKKITSKHKRTLIITWMNIKGNIYADIESTKFDACDYSYKEDLVNLLTEMKINPKKYELIHYQSGQDRAVNVYNDCDAVIFLGVHKIHSVAITQFNRYNKTSMTQLDYQAQMIIQAICRTQIRMHNPKKFTDVYFTTDWSSNLIKYVDLYINKNYQIDEIDRELFSNSWINNVLPRWREKILILNDEFDDSIKHQILNYGEDSEELQLDLHKQRLLELFPSDGSLKRYDPLLKYLREFGIRLIILVPVDRYLRISKDGIPCKFTIYQEEMYDYINKGYKILTKFNPYSPR